MLVRFYGVEERSIGSVPKFCVSSEGGPEQKGQEFHSPERGTRVVDNQGRLQKTCGHTGLGVKSIFNPC